MVRTTKEIADFLGGELVGDGSVQISGLNGINEAKKGDLAFLLSSKQEDLIVSTGASAVVVPRDIKRSFNKPIIKVESPSIAFSKVIEAVMPGRIPHPKGIHPTAIVSKKAVISGTASLGAYTVVEDGAHIDDAAVIYPFCYIGKNSKVGKKCVIYPGVTVREEVSIGNNVIIHPSSVIGSDGFGYDTRPDGTHVKIPQLGTVVIEDDVEIGACVTVDRARFDKTVIGKGSKIDNLVQIAHNVVIGPNCIIVGQSGISGSSKLGRNVTLAGQVGVADHVKLGDFVVAGAKTGISKSFPANTTLFGIPAREISKAKDLVASLGLLPKLYERVRKLEERIKKTG